ncbi:branched-chain alpha-keto acid dehydrogenase subunit E2 [Sphingomonas oleivorans]|uniref:Dihydrolipoamide acetyltransferase component of pyruvate dehydrogenase complex n=1 Tax=Sphingomonas oleivorans TaxID=1735121 RepID=A0A2T5FV56_9SPHN|nr:dihydrolipoamide acetyltransferase family protein [Sphingomonas oleivorans]PTQ08616.1 branched-chain alpha-keto acid dehydrogenase subunit E2 [Sphingomonas oleivorans]
MARIAFKLPDIGEGIAEAEIVAWHVRPGDHVEEDQPLADMMTDKATVEMTAPVTGRIVEIGGEVGDQLAIGSILAVFETDEGVAVAEGPAAVAPVPEAEPRPAGEEKRREGKILASPAVRARARALNIDLAAVKPASGERVRHADLDAYLLQGKAPAAPAPIERDEVKEIRLVGLRRRIAENMAEAKRSIPHFSYVEEVDVTALEALRAAMNAERGARPKLTLLPFLATALAKALPHFPMINARYDDKAGVVARHSAVHLGIATQTEAGLLVPVIRNAQARDIWALAGEIARLADAVRQGHATSEELSGSTITLTSLGGLGGIVSTPIINRPEVAIMGVNRIVERPVAIDGRIELRRMMNLSSSFDHRVVDGYDAARFIQAVKRLIETPALLFVA